MGGLVIHFNALILKLNRRNDGFISSHICHFMENTDYSSPLGINISTNCFDGNVCKLMIAYSSAIYCSWDHGFINNNTITTCNSTIRSPINQRFLIGEIPLRNRVYNRIRRGYLKIRFGFVWIAHMMLANLVVIWKFIGKFKFHFICLSWLLLLAFIIIRHNNGWVP